MTPSERTVLTYMLKKGVPVSDSQLQNQLGFAGGSLGVIMRSLKRQLLVEQDGRYYRATEATAQILEEPSLRAPFGEGPAW